MKNILMTVMDGGYDAPIEIRLWSISQTSGSGISARAAVIGYLYQENLLLTGVFVRIAFPILTALHDSPMTAVIFMLISLN